MNICVVSSLASVPFCPAPREKECALHKLPEAVGMLLPTSKAAPLLSAGGALVRGQGAGDTSMPLLVLVLCVLYQSYCRAEGNCFVVTTQASCASGREALLADALPAMNRTCPILVALYFILLSKGRATVVNDDVFGQPWYHSSS